MKIAIGRDHAGFPYKDGSLAMHKQPGHMVLDFDAHSMDPVDYPAYAHAVAEDVEAAIRRAFPHAEIIIHQDPVAAR